VQKWLSYSTLKFVVWERRKNEKSRKMTSKFVNAFFRKKFFQRFERTDECTEIVFLKYFRPPDTMVRSIRRKTGSFCRFEHIFLGIVCEQFTTIMLKNKEVGFLCTKCNVPYQTTRRQNNLKPLLRWFCDNHASIRTRTRLAAERGYGRSSRFNSTV
jgi:hypothetical protein